MLWISQERIMALPTKGVPWETMLAASKRTDTVASLKDQNSGDSTVTLANAYVYARTGETTALNFVIDRANAIVSDKTIVTGTRALALARELLSYVISMDVINLKLVNPTLHAAFCDRIRYLLHEQPCTQGPATLWESSNKRPNNWGAHALASRIAVDLYIGDEADRILAAQVFHGYLGNRDVYAGFVFGDDLSWQPDPAHPVAICPVGAMKDTHTLDGAQPEELRRGGHFTWPPPTGSDAEMYAFEALQGLTVASILLENSGLPALDWEDQAIMRAVRWLYTVAKWYAEGDDEWQVFLWNAAYNLGITTNDKAISGKNMAWTAWTHPAGTVIETGGNGGGGGGGGDMTPEEKLAKIMTLLDQIDLKQLEDDLQMFTDSIQVWQTNFLAQMDIVNEIRAVIEGTTGK